MTNIFNFRIFGNDYHITFNIVLTLLYFVIPSINVILVMVEPHNNNLVPALYTDWHKSDQHMEIRMNILTWTVLC